MEITRIEVSLEGLSDIMFDRFFDHSKEDRPPEKKLYLNEKDEVVLPAENIYSFLFRDMPPVGVIRFVEKRGAKDYIAIGQSHLTIEPMLIPFLDEKRNPIKFTGFENSQFYVNDWSAPLTKMPGGKVIKQEVRKRPVLRLPWFLFFEINLVPNNDKVTPEKLESWFKQGGLVIALGSFRPRYGRFMVQKWEVKK